MAIKTLFSAHGKRKFHKLSSLLGLILLSFMFLAAGTAACKRAGEDVSEEKGPSIEEGILEFEGTVKTALGKYLYIPEAQGFDIIVQGKLDSGEVSTLIGKEVKGKGEFSPERPAVLLAKTIELKEDTGLWRPIFTRSEEFVLDDYLDLKTRDTFPALEDISYDKKDIWEGQEKAKIYGSLEKEDEIYKINVVDNKGEQVGKIIVDNISDFGLYHVRKLRLFDSFWFYITVKDTVDWQVRRKTREMFQADVLAAGLF